MDADGQFVRFGQFLVRLQDNGHVLDGNDQVEVVGVNACQTLARDIVCTHQDELLHLGHGGNGKILLDQADGVFAQNAVGGAVLEVAQLVLGFALLLVHHAHQFHRLGVEGGDVTAGTLYVGGNVAAGLVQIQSGRHFVAVGPVILVKADAHGPAIGALLGFRSLCHDVHAFLKGLCDTDIRSAQLVGEQKQMHVAVDEAGAHKGALQVDHLRGGPRQSLHLFVRSNGHDDAVLDRDSGDHGILVVQRLDLSVIENSVHVVHKCPPCMAQMLLKPL